MTLRSAGYADKSLELLHSPVFVPGRPKKSQSAPCPPAKARTSGTSMFGSRLRGLAATVWAAMMLWPGLDVPTGVASESSVLAPLAIESLLLDGALAGSRLVVVGERGHILVSTDNGETWKQAQVPTRALLTALHMHDEHTGWAVGHDAVILRTVNGGETWALIHEAPEEELPLLDVWFRDRNAGIAVGAYGYALATEDGGETWRPRVISEDDFHLNALIPVEGQNAGSARLYIAAEAGVIYRSDDSGDTWQELPSPYAGSWFGGLALDEHQIILAGLRGHLFRSDNDGNSWIELESGTQATLTGVARLADGTIIVTGLEGSVLTSNDGGHNVSSGSLLTREGISSALPLSDGTVLLTGEFGIMRLSPDE